MSHVKPGMGELKFLNWAWSFLASHVRTTSRDFIAIKKSADQEIRKLLQHGTDLTFIEVEALQGDIDQIVKFLQHPPMNGDLLKVIQGVGEQFDKRVGLTELMYGESPRQMRSASEAEIKTDQLKLRPDDMANKVEEAMTEVAKKEAICARWHLRGPDVLPVLGPAGAHYWEQLVAGADADALTRQLEYRIEAGSTRKHNRERQANNMTQAMNNLFAPLMQYAGGSGNVGPVNAIISDWAKSIDLDASKYLISPPPPPPGAPGAPGAAPPAKAPSANGRMPVAA